MKGKPAAPPNEVVRDGIIPEYRRGAVEPLLTPRMVVAIIFLVFAAILFGMTEARHWSDEKIAAARTNRWYARGEEIGRMSDPYAPLSVEHDRIYDPCGELAEETPVERDAAWAELMRGYQEGRR